MTIYFYNYLLNLPIDLYIYIFKFINPISLPLKNKKKTIWCKKCGEYLKNGDWYFNFEHEDFYLFYECKYCNNEIIFRDPDLCDIVIKQDYSDYK